MPEAGPLGCVCGVTYEEAMEAVGSAVPGMRTRVTVFGIGTSRELVRREDDPSGLAVTSFSCREESGVGQFRMYEGAIKRNALAMQALMGLIPVPSRHMHVSVMTGNAKPDGTGPYALVSGALAGIGLRTAPSGALSRTADADAGMRARYWLGTAASTLVAEIVAYERRSHAGWLSWCGDGGDADACAAGMVGLGAGRVAPEHAMLAWSLPDALAGYVTPWTPFAYAPDMSAMEHAPASRFASACPDAGGEAVASYGAMRDLAVLMHAASMSGTDADIREAAAAVSSGVGAEDALAAYGIPLR